MTLSPRQQILLLSSLVLTPPSTFDKNMMTNRMAGITEEDAAWSTSLDKKHIYSAVVATVTALLAAATQEEEKQRHIERATTSSMSVVVKRKRKKRRVFDTSLGAYDCIMRDSLGPNPLFGKDFILFFCIS